MNRNMIMLVAALAISPAAADAKGCIKGAIVGGVAGHYAHHHAIAGAAAGCVAGHYLAKRQAAQRQAVPNAPVHHWWNHRQASPPR